jgi:hypothetical protein
MTLEIGRVRGVANHYGVRDTSNKYGGQESTKMGAVKSAEWAFTWDNLPAALNSNLAMVIPANASIVSAKLIVDVAFTSTSTTTDLDIGLYTKAGVAIDVDGLVDATEATQTAIGTAGNIITGAGALVGTTIGAVAGQVVVTPSASDLLTGEGRLIVEYTYDQ